MADKKGAEDSYDHTSTSHRYLRGKEANGKCMEAFGESEMRGMYKIASEKLLKQMTKC